MQTAVANPIVKRMYEAPFKVYMMDEFMAYFGVDTWDTTFPLQNGKLVIAIGSGERANLLLDPVPSVDDDNNRIYAITDVGGVVVVDVWRRDIASLQ